MTDVPDRCRAAVMTEAPGSLQLVDVPVPAELEPGAILVRMLSATVCASDVHVWDGSMAMAALGMRPPVILGHEMTGQIVRLGEGSDTDSIGRPLSVGDQIVWTHGFCGRCVNCVVEREPTLCTRRRLYMGTPCDEYPYLTGGFAEYCYVFPSSGRLRVPAALPASVVAAASCSLRTVIHAFERLGRLEPGLSVAIQGSGPLGLFALALAVAAGVRNAIVIGGPSERLALAQRWGASLTIDIDVASDPAERRQIVLDASSGLGADVVVEVSGAPPAFSEGIDLLRAGGRFLVVGQAHTRSSPFNATSIVVKQATVIGSLSGSVEHYMRGMAFLARWSDRFDWTEMISSHRPLDQIEDALIGMKNLSEIKPAITFP